MYAYSTARILVGVVFIGIPATASFLMWNQNRLEFWQTHGKSRAALTDECRDFAYSSALYQNAAAYLTSNGYCIKYTKAVMDADFRAHYEDTSCNEYAHASAWAKPFHREFYGSTCSSHAERIVKTARAIELEEFGRKVRAAVAAYDREHPETAPDPMVK